MKDVFWYESSEVKVPLGKALGSYLYNTQQQCHELSKNKQNSADVNGNIKILETKLLIFSSFELIISSFVLTDFSPTNSWHLSIQMVLNNKLLLCCYLLDSKRT